MVEQGTLTEPKAQVHEIHPPRLIAERYAAWASGSLHWEVAEDFGGRIADARQGESGPIAEALFDLYVMGQTPQFPRHSRRVKDWAYTLAADHVATRRGPARFQGYAVAWGRQAARDGLFRALWPDEWTPGRLVRSREFGCGERPYARLRDFVQREATRLLAQFESDLSQLHGVT